jgi:hypothetical protein
MMIAKHHLPGDVPSGLPEALEKPLGAGYACDGDDLFAMPPPERANRGAQPRFALECQIDKIAEDLSLDPAELRKRILQPGNSVTANWLRIGSMGLGQCIDAVVDRSEWRRKYRQLPFGRGVGLACSSYISGAGLPIYWNAMPHSGVQLKLDRSGGEPQPKRKVRRRPTLPRLRSDEIAGVAPDTRPYATFALMLACVASGRAPPGRPGPPPGGGGPGRQVGDVGEARDLPRACEDEPEGGVRVQARADVGMVRQGEEVEAVPIGLLCHPEQLRPVVDAAVGAEPEDHLSYGHEMLLLQ